MRRLTPVLGYMAIACVAGCAGMRIHQQLSQARGTPIVSVERPSFDGEHLTGRLLISSEDGGYVVVDRRLPALNIIAVDTVLDCDGGATVDYIAADAVTTSPSPEELLSIEPGYWYGRDFSLFMYDRRIAHSPPPECIDVLVAVNLEGAAASHDRPQVMVRAYLSTADGGSSPLDRDTRQPDAGQPAGERLQPPQ